MLSAGAIAQRVYANVLLAAGLALCAAVNATAAQGDYPTKSVRVIVPFAPGGTNDIVGRVVAARLGERWGQPFVADNRAGGSGVIGTDLVAKAPPDGYTLLMANINFATNPAMLGKLPYDTARDFAPVALLATSPTLLVVHPSLPVKSVSELVAHARANPGKLNYSTSGSGSTTHISMELLVSLTGIKVVPVHYKGGGLAVTDLLGGHVPVGFATILSVLPHVQAGRLRALAVSSLQRSPAVSNIPTVAESGVPGYEFVGWWGVAAPAKTPSGVIAKLNDGIGAVLREPDVRDRLEKEGADPAAMSPAQFGAYIRSEVAKWSDVIRQARMGEKQ